MKVQSSETTYKAKYFQIKKKTFERNGKTFTKDFIERNPVVMIIPYTTDGQIYLESQYRDAHARTGIEVIAGNMEAPFDPLENAKRELKEEAGLTAAKWKLIAQWEISPNMKAPLYIYAATDLTEGEQELDIDEEIDIVKMPIEEAIKRVMDGTMDIAVEITPLLFFEKLWKEGKL